MTILYYCACCILILYPWFVKSHDIPRIFPMYLYIYIYIDMYTYIHVYIYIYYNK